MKEAEYWRLNPLPQALESFLIGKGVKIDECIFLEYEQDFPGCSTDEGLIVFPDGKFFRFEMDLANNRTTMAKLYVWENVSDEYVVNAHKKGTGASWAYLALEVLEELNGC